MGLLEVRTVAAAESSVRLKAELKAEPLSEPPRGRRYRSWMGMGDEEVVAAVNAFVRENGIPNRTRLWKEDAGMADRVRKRGLWERIEFAGKAERPKDGRAGKADAGEIPPEAGACARAKEARAPAGFSREEAATLAQSTIDELEMSSLGELERLDPEMHAIVMETGAADLLSFAETGPPHSGKNGAVHPGEEGDKPKTDELRAEESMYRLILSECFGLGSANPALGSRRGTIQSLQCGIKRKLKGPADQRRFKKCWGRMEAEGLIAYNSNRTAASLDLSARSPGDSSLRCALVAAMSEQAGLGPEWRGKFGTG